MKLLIYKKIAKNLGLSKQKLKKIDFMHHMKLFIYIVIKLLLAKNNLAFNSQGSLV